MVCLSQIRDELNSLTVRISGWWIYGRSWNGAIILPETSKNVILPTGSYWAYCHPVDPVPSAILCPLLFPFPVQAPPEAMTISSRKWPLEAAWQPVATRRARPAVWLLPVLTKAKIHQNSDIWIDLSHSDHEIPSSRFFGDHVCDSIRLISDQRCKPLHRLRLHIAVNFNHDESKKGENDENGQWESREHYPKICLIWHWYALILILSCNITEVKRCKSGQAASQRESVYVFISIPVHSRCAMLCLQRRTSSKQGLCVTARKAPNAGPQKWIELD